MNVAITDRAGNWWVAAGRMLERVDPRAVRMRDAAPRGRRLLVGAAAGALALAVGAAALALAVGGEPESAPGKAPAVGPAAIETADRDDVEAKSPIAAEKNPDGPRSAARHPRFHDPFYVFTAGEVSSVSAYPLASPPGLVVNLEGAPEPERPAVEMVGKDDRVRAVRRIVTGEGLRYAIRTSTRMRRIEVIHEGEVVIVVPRS
ncbi:MAG: hypothetical protein R6V85_20770 [Polyangia bacterium]